MRINQRREAAVKMAIGYLFEEGGDASSVCRAHFHYRANYKNARRRDGKRTGSVNNGFF
jgi:hypothetical protein